MSSEAALNMETPSNPSQPDPINIPNFEVPSSIVSSPQMATQTPDDSLSTVSSPDTVNNLALDQVFRRQRAEFYLNSIPLAIRHSDLEAVDLAEDRLIKLADALPEQSFSGTEPSRDQISNLYLSRAARRQVIGKWQSALDALDCIDVSFLHTHREHAVSYWHIKALIYLGLGKLDEAEEAGIKALELARESLGSVSERGRNTAYFIMAVVMAKKEDRMEAAFYKSLFREAGQLDRQLLEKQWDAFDGICGDFGVRKLEKLGILEATLNIDEAPNSDPIPDIIPDPGIRISVPGNFESESRTYNGTGKEPEIVTQYPAESSTQSQPETSNSTTSTTDNKNQRPSSPRRRQTRGDSRSPKTPATNLNPTTTDSDLKNAQRSGFYSIAIWTAISCVSFWFILNSIKEILNSSWLIAVVWGLVIYVAFVMCVRLCWVR